MPTVPSYDSQRVAARPVGAPAFSMRAPDASGLAQGIQQVERGATALYQKSREEADTAFVMELAAEAEQFEQNLKFDPEGGVYSLKGKNALDVTNKALGTFDEKWRQIKTQAQNEHQRKRLDALRDGRRASLANELNRYEYRERETYKGNAENALLQASLKGAGLHYNDPDKINRYLQQGSAVIQSRANRLGLDEQSVRLEEETFRNDLATEAIQMMEPGEQMNALTNPGIGDLLEPGKRQALQRAAIQQQEAQLRMQLAKEDRARREQERYERVVLEESTKQGDNLLAQGELTEEWIEANRDNLGAGEYRYFYRQLREGGNLNTDPQHYANLRLRVSSGEDVREEARASVHAGSLALSDYNTLVTASERNAPASSVPNVYKRGTDYIRSALRVSDINPDPASAQRQASALDDWSQWITDNPSATSADSREQYMRITQEYALIDYEQMTLTKRMPRFVNATRQGMNLTQLETAGEQTVQAFQAGEISQQEFDEQALLIEEWMDALRRRQGVPQ